MVSGVELLLSVLVSMFKTLEHLRKHERNYNRGIAFIPNKTPTNVRHYIMAYAALLHYHKLQTRLSSLFE